MWTVVAVAAGLVAWSLPATLRFLPHATSDFWGMLLGALVVDIPIFGLAGRKPLRTRATLSVCFTLAIFLFWGAAVAIVAQALAGATSALAQRHRPVTGLFLAARLVCTTAVAGLVLFLVTPDGVTPPKNGLRGVDLLNSILLGAVWSVATYGLLMAARASTRRPEVQQSMTEIRLDVVRTGASVVILVPLLAAMPGWWPLLIALPMLVLNQLVLEQVRHEQQLTRDPVSGLLSRQGLAGGVRAMTAFDVVGPEGPRPFGIILVNVESVLGINRTLGRELYEKAFTAASRRVIDAYGDDRAAQLSSDGIAIMVPDLAESDALAAAQDVVAMLEPPIEVDGIPFTLHPAGGVALAPQHGQDLSTLLLRAELAASEARRTGKPAVTYLHKAAELAERRIALLRELHTALKEPARRREITVLFQPQVVIATGRLFSVEALVRWTHPEWGPVPTDEFIQAIESSDVMHLLTRHVLETTLAQMRRWNERGDPVRVAVNVSAQDLHDPHFLDELHELIHLYGIAPKQLVVEITERMLIADTPQIQHVAAALSRLGVGLSLDDFGTGHASLQQLRMLPLTEVKVDRSYVCGMVDNPADAAIVASVHELARTLHVDVIAEGVESRAVADALSGLPGTIGQGWYFGHPMNVRELHRWRRSR